MVIKIMRINKRITNLRSFDHKMNSPCLYQENVREEYEEYSY